MLDKVTRWVLCLPDNTLARYEGHVPCLHKYHQTVGWQGLNRGSLFPLAIMSEYSYATWTNEMHTFQTNTLIHFFCFWLLHVSNLMGSFSGWFKTCKRHKKLKKLIKVLIWKVHISLVHVAWLYHNAQCKKHKSHNILLIVQLTGTLCYVCKHWNSQFSNKYGM